MYHYLQTESGSGCVSVKGKTILLEQGQGILFAPFVPHSYRALEGRWITEFATFTGSMEPYLKTMIGTDDYLLIGEEKIEPVIAGAVKLFETTPGNTRQLSMDCYHLLLLFSEGIPHSAAAQPAWDKYVRPVVEQIESNYMEDLSAEQLAKSVYVSPQYLSRLFVRDRKIQEIAHDVGYTDASHFIVMFRKLTGMTPVEFRRLHI